MKAMECHCLEETGSRRSGYVDWSVIVNANGIVQNELSKLDSAVETSLKKNWFIVQELKLSICERKQCALVSSPTACTIGNENKDRS